MITFKKLFTFSLLVLFAFQLSAQISVGVRGGVNLATWSGVDDLFDDLGAEKSSTTGFVFGGIFNIGISENFSIQPELLYFQKGVIIEQEIELFGFKISSKSQSTFNYLEIPILGKYTFGDTDGTHFFATAGPSIGYLLSGKTKSETTVDGETEKEEEDLDFDTDGILRTDFGLSLGAGAGFAVGPGVLNIDVRYLLGLSNLVDSDDDSVIQNRGLNISVGFLLPITQ